jgi:hypothetical protein
MKFSAPFIATVMVATANTSAYVRAAPDSAESESASVSGKSSKSASASGGGEDLACGVTKIRAAAILAESLATSILVALPLVSQTQT